MSKRIANKEARTEKMIEAAIEVFTEKGIEPTKMTDIAKVSGIGVASIYRYFKTKGDIAIEVGIKYWGDVHQKVIQACDPGQMGFHNMKTMLELFLDHNESDMQVYRFIEQLDHFITKLDKKPDKMTDYELAVIKNIPLYIKYIDEGKKDGSIHESVNSTQSIHLFNHTLMSLKQKHASRGAIISTDTVESQQAELRLLTDIFLNYLKHGL